MRKATTLKNSWYQYLDTLLGTKGKNPLWTPLLVSHGQRRRGIFMRRRRINRVDDFLRDRSWMKKHAHHFREDSVISRPSSNNWRMKISNSQRVGIIRGVLYFRYHYSSVSHFLWSCSAKSEWQISWQKTWEVALEIPQASSFSSVA